MRWSATCNPEFSPIVNCNVAHTMGVGRRPFKATDHPTVFAARLRQTAHSLDEHKTPKDRCVSAGDRGAGHMVTTPLRERSTDYSNEASGDQGWRSRDAASISCRHGASEDSVLHMCRLSPAFWGLAISLRRRGRFDTAMEDADNASLGPVPGPKPSHFNVLVGELDVLPRQPVI